MKNLVIITADDLSAYSLGIGFSPNIDNFGGFKFLNAHCNITFCQPSRATLMTGLYPQNNGSTAFVPMKPNVVTLAKILKNQGYFTGILGKKSHHQPECIFQWSYKDPVSKGRNLEETYKNFKKITAKEPFFALVNFPHPHRPFINRKNVNPKDVQVPIFLNDTKRTRRELANYYQSVKKLDEAFQNIINLINLENTDVVFTSDHGMSFPFVKGNCYHYSTNIPLIYKSTSILTRTDTTHLVSHVDILPTILDLMGIDHNYKFDGTSYYTLLTKGEQDGFTFVYSQLNAMAHGPSIRMRALSNKDYSYVINIDKNYPAHHVDGWGWHEFLNGFHNKLLYHRPKEEFIELKTNKNVIDKETKLSSIFRNTLFDYMAKYKDSLANKVAKPKISILYQ